MKKWVVGWRANNGIYTKHFYALAETSQDALRVLSSYKKLWRLNVRYVFEADLTTSERETFLETKKIICLIPSLTK